MNLKIKELIEKLQSKLVDYQKKLEKIQGEISYLKNNPPTSQNNFWEKEQDTISKQKKELEDLGKRLFECSESRKEIQVKLEKKVVELENSNLAREEVVKQVIQLLTKSGFTEVKERLLETWKNYAKSRDDFNRLRHEALKIKEERTREAVMSLEVTKKGLWITVFALLIIVVLLSLSLLLLSANIKKKKKQ